MANPPLKPETHSLIWEYAKQGFSHREIIKQIARNHGVKVAVGTVSKWKSIPPTLQRPITYQAPGIRSDKKRGEFDWEEWSFKIEEMQALKARASSSQDNAFVELGDGNHDVGLIYFSDQHMGSWGCNYTELRRLTREIRDTPNLFMVAGGDEGQYSIKLRSVLEVSDNAIPPEYQTKFVQGWWDSIWHKVAAANWDNHAVERQEKQAGESAIKAMKAAKVVYFNGIGHLDIKVGNEIYRGAISHRFRGTSMLNPVHGVMRYMRFEGTDREWGMMGDLHTPGMLKYTDGDKTRVAINAGSLQNNSGYAKRYFSLTTHPAFPLIVFHHDKHCMTPYWSVREWLDSKR